LFILLQVNNAVLPALHEKAALGKTMRAVFSSDLEQLTLWLKAVHLTVSGRVMAHPVN